MFQTRFILYGFDDCFQLLFVWSHIFSYFFYVNPAKQEKNLHVQEGESYQNPQESDLQMFRTLLYSDRMDFSSFSPILFRFFQAIHLAISFRFTYQYILE